MPSSIDVSARQLQSLLLAMMAGEEEVGELDDFKLHADFTGDVITAIAQYSPKSLMNTSVMERLASTGPESLFIIQDLVVALAEKVCEYCGGEVTDNIRSGRDTIIFEIAADDCIAGPDDILSSGAWRYAHKMNGRQRDAEPAAAL